MKLSYYGLNNNVNDGNNTVNLITSQILQQNIFCLAMMLSFYIHNIRRIRDK